MAPNQLGGSSSTCLFRIIGIDIFEQISIEDDIFKNEIQEEEALMEINESDLFKLRVSVIKGALCVNGLVFKDTGSLSQIVSSKEGVQISISIKNISHLFGFSTLTFTEALLTEASNSETLLNVSLRLRYCWIGEFLCLEVVV